MIPFGVARLLHAVEANTELVVLTEPASHVHRRTDLPFGGEFGDGLVGRPFRHHVDPAADTATRRNAIDHLARAFEDVHPLGHFHVDRVGGQNAVKAVVGNVAVEQAETTDGELFVTPARRVGSVRACWFFTASLV